MKKIAFTIVLNGMPFIKKQAEILPKVFDEWHIIEGATLPKEDTAWCRPIDSEFYSSDKLSIDGTKEFIDNIVDNKKIFVHRKGDFWTSKTEMCNSISHLMENSVLMQFDVDEIWTPDTLIDLLDYCETNNGFDGMLFKCNYYLGPNIKVISNNTYGDKMDEWCRLWKIGDRTTWKSHEPPRIHGLYNFLSKTVTEKKGWTFNHYAYVLEEQVRFKENFYGYTDALEHWKKLQLNTQFPCYAREFIPWITDNTVVSIETNES